MIPGYVIYHVDRQSKRGGGICAYVSRNYKTENLRSISLITASGFHQLWLKIHVRNVKSFIVCTTYRPPDSPVSCFDSDLTESFIYASSFNKPIYLLGDINCRLKAKALINFCLSYNLSQLITIPTRVTENSKSILDIILVSHTKQVQRAKVMKSRISDNDLVCVTLKLKKARCKPVYFTARSLKHYRSDTFYNDASLATWSIVDVFDDVEDKVHTVLLKSNAKIDKISHLSNFLRKFKSSFVSYFMKFRCLLWNFAEKIRSGISCVRTFDSNFPTACVWNFEVSIDCTM